jgi:hypothetical protein
MTRAAVRTSATLPPSSTGTGRQALDPELGARSPRVSRELSGVVALGQILVELPAGEVGRRLGQLTLIGGQCELHAVPPPASLAYQPAVAGARDSRPSRDTPAVAARSFPAGRWASRSAAACARASAWSVSGASGSKSW